MNANVNNENQSFTIVSSSNDLCTPADPCGGSAVVATDSDKPVNGKSARVVIQQDDSEEDVVDEEQVEEGDDEDLLETLPDESEDIDLIHARLATLQQLRLPRFGSHLKRLCLRQNYIGTLDDAGIDCLKELEELDMYDNKLKDLSDCVAMLPLKKLDLSFNLFRVIPGVIESLTQLHTVYFVQNKISKISGLGRPLGASLKSLELGGNRIRTIENLDALVNLEELWLGKNKITKLQNLESLTKLRIISIQSNRITKIEGLEALVNLEEFYISHNGIEKIEGLDNNLKLTVLDVGSNKISEIEGLSQLASLKEFWASENKIPTVHALEPQLGKIESLETIYLEGNPCQKDDMAGYRRKVILALPRLIQLDATYVKRL